jgi:hypothetical protein
MKALIERKRKLKEYARRKGIVALYLFGSVVQGRATQLSDVDIAVLLPHASAANLFEKRLQMIVDLMEILNEDDVDLVILNEAPPLLCHRIITEGELVHSCDEKERVRFEARKVLEYLDFKPILELQHAYMRRRLKEGKFGYRPRYRRTAIEKA